MKLKTLGCTLKAAGPTTDEPNGYVEGYASTWDVDLTGDRFVQGAYTKTIADKVGAGKVKLYDNHQTWEALSNTLIGGVRTAREDAVGMWVHCAFASTEAAQNCRMLAMDGILTDFSVGVRIIRDSFNTNQQIREIQECSLSEISMVGSPANPYANIYTVKSAAPAKSFEVAPVDTPWDENEALKRFQAWVNPEPQDKWTLKNWAAYRRGFLYTNDRNPKEPDMETKYLLADVIGNQPVFVPRAALASHAEISQSDALPLDRKSLLDCLQPVFDKVGITPEPVPLVKSADTEDLRKALVSMVVAEQLRKISRGR